MSPQNHLLMRVRGSYGLFSVEIVLFHYVECKCCWNNNACLFFTA